LRPFPHPLLYTHPFALKYGEWVREKLTHCRPALGGIYLVHIGDNDTRTVLCKYACVTLYPVRRYELSRLSSYSFEKREVFLECRSGKWKRDGIDRNRMSGKNRMKRELNVVKDITVSKLRYRTLNDDVLPQVPSTQGVKSYEFDKGAKSTASCLLPVRSITEHGLSQSLLKSVY